MGEGDVASSQMVRGDSAFGSEGEMAQLEELKQPYR